LRAVHIRVSRSWNYSVFVNICVLLVAAVSPSVSFGQSGVNLYATKEARKAVVPIVCLVRARNDKQIVRYRAVGTGFLVDMTGTFVTAAHVIGNFPDSTQKTACRGAIAFSSGEAGAKAREKQQWSTLSKSEWERPPKGMKWFPVDFATCHKNYQFDVAVCKTMRDLTVESVSHDVAIISPEPIATGTNVFFIGFSLRATDPIVTAATMTSFPDVDSGYSIQIDKSAWPGASGSPIFLPDGKQVVGMITKTGIENSAGLSFGIAGEKLADLLAKTKAKSAEEEKPNKANPPGL
jgi:trypsin-like peptidase